MSQVAVEQQPIKKTSSTAAVAKKAVKDAKPAPVKTERVEKSDKGATSPIATVAKSKAKKLTTPKELPGEESVVVAAPVVEDVPVAAAGDDSSSKASNEKVSRRRKNFNQLLADVEVLNSIVEQYISDHKDIKSTSELSKFLKSVDKGLKKVRSQVQKFGKQKTQTTANNSHSGFQKPVRISSQVAEFTGWDVSQPRARVEVTNFVCDYIRSNSLQSPTDKRVILADARLSSLLEYQRERDGDLTYATIQKLLAKHYSPIVPSSA